MSSNDKAVSRAEIAARLSAISKQYADKLITRGEMNRMIAELKARASK